MKRKLAALTVTTLLLTGCTAKNPTAEVCDLMLHPTESKIEIDQLEPQLRDWSEQLEGTDIRLSANLGFLADRVVEAQAGYTSAFNENADRIADYCLELGYE